MELYQDKNVAYIIACTEFQIYQFMGNSNLEQLFGKYREKEKDPYHYLENTFKIFPNGNQGFSQIQMLYTKTGKFSSFGWITLAGFVYAEYQTQGLDKLLSNFKIINFPKPQYKDQLQEYCKSEYPKGMAHSDYHVYLLFSETLVVVSKLTRKVVHTENLQQGEKSIYYDKRRSCLYILIGHTIKFLEIENESADAWKALIEKGEYDAAINQCRLRSMDIQIKQIKTLYAFQCYENGDYEKSAALYADSDERFEEVCLKMLLKNQTEALKIYLLTIEKKLEGPGSESHKLLILCWITEIFATQISNSKDSSHKKEQRDKFKNFLKANLGFLEKTTVYHILNSYGLIKELLEFAQMKKDYEYIIVHYINNKENSYETAIEKLYHFINLEKENSNSGDNKGLSKLYELFSKYCHLFMKYHPQLTIEKLMKHLKSLIDPSRLVSAVLSVNDSSRAKLIDFLEEFIYKLKSKERSIHNLYVLILASVASELAKSRLIKYMEMALKGKLLLIEIEYVTRVFIRQNCLEAAAISYAIVGRHEKGTEVALKGLHFEVAKKIANLADQPNIRNQIWMHIFRTAIKDSTEINPATAVDIINESKVLKIDNIIQELKGSVKLSTLRSVITKRLNELDGSVKNYLKEISIFNETAVLVKKDIGNTKKKYMEINTKNCTCMICLTPTKEVYMFPCGHTFDEDCILSQIIANKIQLESRILHSKVERLIDLKKEIEKYERRKDISLIKETDTIIDERHAFFNFTGVPKEGKPKTGPKKISISCGELDQLIKMKQIYNELLLEECVICGDIAVDLISVTFNHKPRESWEIK